MVENPGMETHIHPFRLKKAHQNNDTNFYLHTSPEFEMKQVLTYCDELENIYTITYCFRDEPHSPDHRPQFLMLEWYRRNVHYNKIMEDTENLTKYLLEKFERPFPQFEKISIADIFKEYTNLNILDFESAKELKEKISKDMKSVPLPSKDCEYDDYFFLIFLNLIEPHLKNHPYLFLYEYPAPLAALSTLKETDSRVCERFEYYINGTEIANCFNELTDHELLLKRFKDQAKSKSEIYGYELPFPEQFMQAMKNGYPKSSGIALGVERLIGSILKVDNPFYR